MYIITSVYGCPIVVVPKTDQDFNKFMGIKGSIEISKATFEANKENLTDTATSYDDGLRINEFVGDCDCWQFINRKRIKR